MPYTVGISGILPGLVASHPYEDITPQSALNWLNSDENTTNWGKDASIATIAEELRIIAVRNPNVHETQVIGTYRYEPPIHDENNPNCPCAPCVADRWEIATYGYKL